MAKKKNKKKLTPNQSEWKKQQKKVERYVKKYEAQGFTFDYTVPKQPKKVTKKALEEFKRETTAIKLSSKAYHVKDEVTGETETLRKAINRRRKTKKISESSDVDLSSFNSFIEKLKFLEQNPYNGYVPGNLRHFFEMLKNRADTEEETKKLEEIVKKAEEQGYFSSPEEAYYYTSYVNEIISFFADFSQDVARDEKAQLQGYYDEKD